MRHTLFWTRRRSLHGSWRRVEGAAECKDSDQHEIRTFNEADLNSKNGDDQDDVVRADAGGRRRTFRRLPEGMASWSDQAGHSAKVRSTFASCLVMSWKLFFVTLSC
jgi:hypothetical protein